MASTSFQPTQPWPSYRSFCEDVGSVAFESILTSLVNETPPTSTDARDVYYFRCALKQVQSGPFAQQEDFASEILERDVILRKAWVDVTRRLPAIKGSRTLRETLRPIVNFLISPNSRHYSSVDRYLTAVDDAWSTDYSGNAAFLALQTIREQSKDNSPDILYGNSVAVVQSSGMGKSRMVHEMGKYVFTIPVNVRRPDHDGHSYPPPDDAIRDFMWRRTSFNDYKDKCACLLSVFFRAAATFLTKFASPLDYCEKVHMWRLFLEKYRTQMYKEVVAYLLKSVGKMTRFTPHEAFLTLKTALDSTYADHIEPGFHPIEELYLKVFADLDADPDMVSELRNDAKADADRAKMALKECGMPITDYLQVMMYFDEAHELLRDPRTGFDIEPSEYPLSYEASKDEPKFVTMYSLLLSALNDIGKQPIHAMFVSTSLHIVHRVQPRRRLRLQPPITELSFDCHPLLLKGLSPHINMAEMSRVSYLARFGRPLFWSIIDAGEKMSTSYKMIQQKVFTLAMAKLAFTADFHIKPGYMSMLAVLDLRLCFDYAEGPLYPNDQAVLVERHMRVLVSVPENRSFFRSGYSSEPLLANASAVVMELWRRGRLWDPIGTLSEWMSREIISRGDQSDVAGRLLLVLAFDSAVRHARGFENDFNYFGGCTVKDWILHLFRDAQKVLDCMPDNIPPYDEVYETTPMLETLPDLESQPQLAPCKTLLGRGRIRILQFVKVSDSSGFTQMGLRAAFIRGVAFISMAYKGLVNAIIPVALPIREDEHVMTAILVQFKDRHVTDFKSTDYSAEDVGLFDDLEEPDVQPPYCTLHMEFGLPPDRDSLEVGNAATLWSDEDESPFPRYNILARGCSSTVYKVIEPKENQGFASLISGGNRLDKHPRKDPEFLQQVQRLAGNFLLDPS